MALSPEQSQRAKQAEKRHNTRDRVPASLPKPDSASFVWKHDHPELIAYTPAVAAVELRESAIWQSAMVPLFEARDGNVRRSCRTVYTAEEIELALFYGLNSGRKTIEGEDGLITYLRHPYRREDLKLLGFANPRVLPDRVADSRRYPDGIPSGARFSAHVNKILRQDRRDAWEQVWLATRDEELALMDDEEFLVGYLDSSNADTIFMPPRFDPETGEAINPEEATCPDGSYLPLDSHDPGARGFKALYLWTRNATCLGTFVTMNKTHDRKLAPPLLAAVAPIVKPRLAALHPKVGVLTADGAFGPDDLRRDIRMAGYIENIARTNRFNDKEVSRLNQVRIPFPQHPGWYTNGHAEIDCECGTAHLTRSFEPAARSGVRAVVVARCPKHGRLHVTSGQYVKLSGEWWTYDPKKAGKLQPPKKKPKTKKESEANDADLRLGNGFTYNYWLAGEFAQDRWGHNEGIHGALANLGIIFNGANRFRYIEEFEIANYQLLTYLHRRAIRRRLLLREATSLRRAA